MTPDRPICRCGCGRPCKRKESKYYSKTCELGRPEGALKPLCRAGCGERVKTWANRWCSPKCIPPESRITAGQKGRKTFAYRKRAEMFSADVDRLPARMTREDLMASHMRVYYRGYNAGFMVGRNGYRRSDVA